MSTTTFGYLQFQTKRGKSPMKYALEVGPTSIGTSLSYDIRLKSKSQGPEAVQCVLDVRADGVAYLENKCGRPVMHNGKKMRRIQVLKHNDEFSIAGKQFQYLNPKNAEKTLKITDSVKAKKRQSVLPNFKTKSESRIPVPSQTITTRRSFSVTKVKNSTIPRRSCASAVPNKKRDIYNWESTNSSNVIAGRSFSTTNKSKDLAVLVRKSLFLKNKNNVPFSNSVAMDCSTTRKSLVLNVDGFISSPRGQKRARESSIGPSFREAKKRKHEEKLSFNLSISGESTFYESESSRSSKEFDSLVDDSTLELASPRKSLRDRIPIVKHSPLMDLISSRSVRKTSTPKIQKTPKTSTTPNNGPLTPKGELFDFKEVATSPRVQKTPKNDSIKAQGVSSLKTRKSQKSPKNDLTDIRGVKKLLKTPKLQKSPKNDLTDIKGVKKLLKSPKAQNSPKNDLSDIRGVKKLLSTPKLQKSPKNDLTDVRGVKELLKTAKVQKSPKNDLTDVRGVKKVLRTPKVPKSPKNDLMDVSGVEKLLKSPKIPKTPLNDLTDIEGVKRIFKTPRPPKSPLNDLTDVRGVKKFLTTPKVQKSPKNDLSDLEGVNRILRTPKQSPRNNIATPLIVDSPPNRTSKVRKSPKNELSNVSGVDHMFSTPKVQNSPKNDLLNISGVEHIFATPIVQKSPPKKNRKVPKSPKNDLSNVSGVAQIFSAPVIQKSPPKKAQKSPKNDLLDISGVEHLFATPTVQSSSPVPEQVSTRTRRKNQKVETPDSFENSLPEKRRRGQRSRPITSTPAQEAETPDKKSVRSRRAKKTAEEETNLKSHESGQKGGNMRVGRNRRVAESVESPKPEPEQGSNLTNEEDGKKVRRRGRPKMKVDENNETPVKRETRRGRKRKSSVVEETLEEVAPVKRAARGQAKKDNEVSAKRSARGRKKAVEEVENNNDEEGKEEEKELSEKKGLRNRRNVVKKGEQNDDTEVKLSEEKSTRGRRKVVKAVEQDQVSEGTKEIEVIEKKVTRGRRKVVKEVEQSNDTERKEEDKLEEPELSEKKTTRSRRKVVKEVVQNNDAEEGEDVDNGEKQEDSEVQTKKSTKSRKRVVKEAVENAEVGKPYNTRRRKK